jgi:hypothetical protein
MPVRTPWRGQKNNGNKTENGRGNRYVAHHPPSLCLPGTHACAEKSCQGLHEPLRFPKHESRRRSCRYCRLPKDLNPSLRPKLRGRLNDTFQNCRTATPMSKPNQCKTSTGEHPMNCSCSFNGHFSRSQKCEVILELG